VRDAAPLESAADGEVLVHVKVVPGASRDEIVGRHGDRLKVRVAAAPEDGRANATLLALLAQRLGLSPRALRLVRGAAAPTKTVGARGLPLAVVAQRLGLDAPVP
jgi:uncharacterized protein (TIGR00251 family)